MGFVNRIIVAIPLGLTIGALSCVSIIGYFNSNLDLAVVSMACAVFVFVMTAAWVESE